MTSGTQPEADKHLSHFFWDAFQASPDEALAFINDVLPNPVPRELMFSVMNTAAPVKDVDFISTIHAYCPACMRGERKHTATEAKMREFLNISGLRTQRVPHSEEKFYYMDIGSGNGHRCKQIATALGLSREEAFAVDVLPTGVDGSKLEAAGRQVWQGNRSLRVRPDIAEQNLTSNVLAILNEKYGNSFQNMFFSAHENARFVYADPRRDLADYFRAGSSQWPSPPLDTDLVGKFDLISILYVLHHVPHWEGLVDQAVAMLKPGGHLVLMEHDCDYTDASCTRFLDASHAAHTCESLGSFSKFRQAHFARYVGRARLHSYLRRSGLDMLVTEAVPPMALRRELLEQGLRGVPAQHRVDLWTSGIQNVSWTNVQRVYMSTYRVPARSVEPAASSATERSENSSSGGGRLDIN
jgi:SAM-dependent methyltransferase